MKRSCLLLLLVLWGLPACDEKAPEAPVAPTETVEAAPVVETAEPEPKKAEAAMPSDLKPGEQGFFGSKFTVIEEPITLAAALEQSTDKAATVKVSATVKTVCKKKGCWFTIGDEGVEEDIRVRMKDYSFFVPKNADGAKVVAEGTLTHRTVPQDEAQHYADDAAKDGEPAKKIEGDQKSWEFTATAVELVAAES